MALSIRGLTPQCRTHKKVGAGLSTELSAPPPTAWSHLCSGSFGCHFKSNRLKRRVPSRDTQAGPPPAPLFYQLLSELRFGIVTGEEKMFCFFVVVVFSLDNLAEILLQKKQTSSTHKKTIPKEKCNISSQLLFPFALYFIAR